MKSDDVTRRAFLKQSALIAAIASTLPVIISETFEAAPNPNYNGLRHQPRLSVTLVNY